MPLLDRLKQHWFGSLIVICVAVAGATWKVAWELHVTPRDFEISGLKDALERAKAEGAVADTSPSSIVLQDGVFQGQSVTTVDGRLAVKVTGIAGDTVSVSLQIDSSPPTEFKRLSIGSRIPIESGRWVYFVDIHRIRANIVDIGVSKHSK
jgi:hypothetical protein